MRVNQGGGVQFWVFLIWSMLAFQHASPVRATQILRNSQYHSAGFWGNGPPPSLSRSPRTYFYSRDRLAAFSNACAPLHDVGRTLCTSFTEIDLFVSLGDVISNREVARAIREHPWTWSEATRGNVQRVQIPSLASFSTYVQNLLLDCTVIRYLFVSGHGIQGQMSFSEQSPVLTSHFISDSHLPCVLTPRSRVQFDNCDQTCHWVDTHGAPHNGGWALAVGLRRTFGNPALRDRGEPTSLDLRFLFNSGEGQVDYLDSHPILDRILRNRLTISDEYNHAVQYVIGHGQIDLDIEDLNSLPACHID